MFRDPNSPVNRFPKQWSAFLEKEKKSSGGLSFENWGMRGAMVATLNAHKFFTVEDLAQASSDRIEKLIQTDVDFKDIYEAAVEYVSNPPKDTESVVEKVSRRKKREKMQ
jgi:hypothetical protein